MARLKIINLKKTRIFLGKLPKSLGEKAFWTFLGLFILALMIGGSIFYKYNILSKEFEVALPEKSLQFEEKNYQQVLQIWQIKERDSKGVDSKEYPNPF